MVIYRCKKKEENNMKTLKDRREIANEINVKRTTAVRIDLADADEYGLKSQKVLIDNGTFNNGHPYLVRSEIRAYCDEMKFTFKGFCTCLSNSFGYSDIEEMVEYANAPVIKPDSDVVLVIVDSKKRQAYAPCVLHTSKRVDPHCTTPLTFTDEDNSALCYMVRSEHFDEWMDLYIRKNTKK